MQERNWSQDKLWWGFLLIAAGCSSPATKFRTFCGGQRVAGNGLICPWGGPFLFCFSDPSAGTLVGGHSWAVHCWGWQ